ncbi:tetratricopeptide repeat protein [Streptomyces sp. NPDC001868]|uniref:tetratricopeptide repeat protein n=1 Tax=Streptomyces sp. NPDC001868 TaxID=3154401 RepID=UPI00332B2BB3
MEFDRRVQIRVDRLKEGKRTRGFGSGYLVAPRLVLTAAHVLDGLDPAAGDPVRVSVPDADEQEFSATVRWQRKDGTVDAALIEVRDGHGWQVPQSLGDLLTRPPQRYGLIIGTRPHPVTATGFPRLQKDAEDGRRLDEQLTGHIAPGTGSLASRYEIMGTGPTPGVGTSGDSQWSGMSGAAVLTDDGFGGDLLCGVVRRDRRADGGTRLTATTSAGLLADPGFRSLITEHTGRAPVLEPVEPASLLTAAALDRTFRSPAALLRADTEAVSFHGRDAELAYLRAWCENKPDAISIRVMTGPGGQGKTRLARRLTDTLGWAGWVTGHLRSDLTDDPAIDGTPPDFTTLNTALPLLLVVDYAETRPRLLRRLITHLHRSRHRVRLLLLARSDGEWRTGSFQAVPDVRDLLEEALVRPLGPLVPAGESAQDRRSAFRRATSDLARLLPEVPTLPTHDWRTLATSLQPPTDLSDPRYDNILTLQMTALVALLQRGPRPVGESPGTPPERTLLKHEERFWEASAKTSTYRLDLPVPTLGAAVAAAALCGADSRDEALSVITTLPGLSARETPSVTAWLASLYPAEKNRYWGSLQPDRVAEYHVSQTLEDSGIALPALLAAGTPAQQTQTITVLARAAIAHYNTNRTDDSENVLRALDTALDSTPLTRSVLQNTTSVLPFPSPVTAPLALRLSTALTQADRRQANRILVVSEPGDLGIRLVMPNEAERAAALSHHGARLRAVGRWEEALAAAEQAVTIYRPLAAEDPAHESELAASLSGLGMHLSQMGRREEALAAAEQAMVIYRRLAAEDLAAHAPARAATLTTLGMHLSQMGRQEEALAAIGQALDIQQRLAADNPTDYEPVLATLLSTLGMHLSQAGRQEEALAAIGQALDIQQRLAADNPTAHEAGLGETLFNLGKYLSQAGRRDEAVAATEQAVAIYQRLAVGNPAVYEPDLATLLTGFGTWLLETERWEEALAAAEQAVDIYHRLAADNPADYEPDLATLLSSLGGHLSQAGRREEALAATQRAVAVYHRLAAYYPLAYAPGLATSLSDLGVHLSHMGRWDEALAAAEQALEIRQRLAAGNPADYEPDLATSLANLGGHLSQVGRQEEALAAVEQAVDIRQRLAADNPAAYEPDLAHSLPNLGMYLSQAGRREEALAAAEQAVAIYQRLAADNPAAYEPDLARSLTSSALLLAREGALPEALRATQEADELYRRHADTLPMVIPLLHATLGLQVDLLEGLGRVEEANAVRRWLAENALPPDSHN